MADYERTRLVVLGGAGVGKSCIVKRFLDNTYSDKYRSTIEDLYSKEFDLGHMSLKVDILDTSGEMEFPAMRRLCIATSHAFLLVYAVTSAPSFQSIKQCFEEIREQRGDFQEIPIVVAGNKLDLTSTHREVRIEDVSEWVYCELPKLRVKVLECSAKDDINIREVFRSFLNLSRIFPKDAEDQSSGLKRTSSAYMHKGGKKAGSPSLDRSKPEGSENGSFSKPRSRSLIRRTSRKAKQQLRDARNGCDDCIVS
ncbi:GTP-binding protein Di-Ras2 [Harmonia axyridis]|uniref:GTP-binding protein Di-Ras2 n=1 Tax=Harmonia axyridis TaxID=115357 RepID=UPI001E2766F4|nr:GTP-binding protein Di-Ras2 [Harmonia axyridis]XP_045462220.1 GTP-binding protein Di-Ras2 [Harmonia axyridis]XP_045462221.1 GTP-binding protein Di-Ras2 [Harmonia axyridis]XP_045462222.1 GTP-binding protein Di-Ras2 [Harmonia axyridis]XP_045462223.1 GTP-binding protein Di-Ras2 [Harmonia axyridis]XP_045462225.1 GTP-binding protein Di-Ras2 [Harmonia axyridis]